MIAHSYSANFHFKIVFFSYNDLASSKDSIRNYLAPIIFTKYFNTFYEDLSSLQLHKLVGPFDIFNLNQHLSCYTILPIFRLFQNFRMLDFIVRHIVRSFHYIIQNFDEDKNQITIFCFWFVFLPTTLIAARTFYAISKCQWRY